MEKFSKLLNKIFFFNKFDLTKEVRLSDDWRKKYLILRAAVYFLAFLACIYIAFQVLFPVKSFDYFFKSAGALKNTIISPRNYQNNTLAKGHFSKDSGLIFDTALAGDFSEAEIILTLEKESLPLESGNVSARKSFQAFFYPEGKSIGFKSGSLLKNKDNYYIVSNGQLRKYTSLQLAKQVGYETDAFLEVLAGELGYHEIGQRITASSKVPDGSIFKVDEIYYQLLDQKLQKFVSEKAFLTQYNAAQVIEKNKDFLDNYDISEEFIGFADGTLISYGISAFIVSRGKIHPINNTITFESMGFDWEDVIPVDGEEIGIYEKTKLFDISQPHPDGTTFADKETGRTYLIENGARRIFATRKVIDSYLQKGPVLADENGLQKEEICSLKKNFSFAKKYSCTMQLNEISDFQGNDYQFKLTSDSDVQISEIRVTFKKNFNSNSLKFSLGDIRNKIKLNYGIQE
ncbi:hypothetical protein ACFLY1_00200 [Patescibacteria group bacterium]